MRLEDLDGAEALIMVLWMKGILSRESGSKSPVEDCTGCAAFRSVPDRGDL